MRFPTEKLKAGDKYKIALMATLIVAAIFLTYYYHAVLGIEVVFTHFFYVPIVLASAWWQRKGILVGLFLVVMLMFGHVVFAGPGPIFDDLIRGGMLLLVSVVVAELSREISGKGRELKESEDRYRIIAENAADVIWIMDMEFNRTYTSPSVERLRGFTPEEVGNMTFDKFITPDSLQQAMEMFAEEMEIEMRGDSDPERSRTFEVEQLRKDGTTVWTEVTARFLRDDDGNPVGVLGVGRDINDRKRAEEELRLHQERLEEIVEERTAEVRKLGMAVEQSIDGMAITDMDGYLQYVNRAWAMMHRRVKDEFIGKHIGFFHDDQQLKKEVIRFFDQVLLTGLHQAEIRQSRKDGTTYPAWVTAALLSDEAGDPFGFVVVARDITERKLAEEELRSINEDLEGFAHTVSHDLKGPLSTIGLATYTLRELLNEFRESEGLADAIEIVSIIDRNVDRSGAFIDELLTLAQAGQEPEEVIDVDVGAVVRSVLDDKDADIEDGSVIINIDDNLGQVTVNYVHAYQLFSNLISNAIQHNDSSSPSVEIRHLGEEEDEGHRYIVRDNGSGVPQDILDKIFKPFFKWESEGTGVGLATVEKIIKLYDGEIVAYNDEGACFEFVIRDARIR
jgi:PAS domain S-box-containing protein